MDFIIKPRDKYSKKYDKATTHEKRHGKGDSKAARREHADGEQGHARQERHRDGEENKDTGNQKLRGR